MKPALVLVDLQNDYLAAPELQPAAGFIVGNAATLLGHFRSRGLPIVHVITTVHRNSDDRMPHWKKSGKWICEAGTPGHVVPAALRPGAGEVVVEKQFFSGFTGTSLEAALRKTGCDTVVFAGIHLHGCVRATALDAYQRGYGVWVAEDATGSDDPLHAAITRRWLADRLIRFVDVASVCGAIDGTSVGRKALGDVAGCAARARGIAGTLARKPHEARETLLMNLADELLRDQEDLARLITREVGKPITMARAEVCRSAAILRAVVEHGRGAGQVESGSGAQYRHRPLGVVAVVTPWNNPLAIPVGRFAPAILFGNAVVWKPAPAGTGIARRTCELLVRSGWRIEGTDLVQLCEGDHSTACALVSDPNVDGVTLSGSLRAGYSLQEVANRRHIPFQAELGGNNAAIVWDDADVAFAASQVASAAFGFAGQRCTANRRAIVSEKIYTRFVEALKSSTAALKWGDPTDESVVIGPLINAAKVKEVEALVGRAKSDGMEVLVPHRRLTDHNELIRKRAYFPPHIVLAGDQHGRSETVQEETFGPVLVVQKAATFSQALDQLNGVRQGLVAALFAESRELWERFAGEARAGVLKFNAGTADADASSPLGGWKASGVGPAEHGPCDREFFCRVQTIYDAQRTDRR